MKNILATAALLLSAVELYRRLPYAGELEPLAERLPAGCTVLELGCGTGRLTRRLLERGCSVTAVDDSADMLIHVPDEAGKVCSSIDSLDLGRRFDVALLASNLINVPSEPDRRALLAACRRHVRQDGCLLFERYDPRWLRSVEVGPLGVIPGGVEIAVERVRRKGRIVEMSLRYTADGEEWRQHFAARALHDGEAQAALRAAGFRTVRWITGRWGEAAGGRVVSP